MNLSKKQAWALLFSVFCIATSGIVYELLIAGYSSYLLGNSIFYYSLIIGTFLSSMGVGSFLSRYVEKETLLVFLATELSLGVIGGCSIVLLFWSYVHTTFYSTFMYSITFVLGTFIGLEIPLLIRLLKETGEFKNILSDIFFLDYIGALVGALALPLLLLPSLGFIRTGTSIGILNLAIALFVFYFFYHEVKWKKILIFCNFIGLIFLATIFVSHDKISRYVEALPETVKRIYSKHSHYQKIELFQFQDNYFLLLNESIQFDSKMEYRYHEALVHPAFALSKNHKNILVLGGGDGLAVREILKHLNVEKITLVDLDPDITGLAKTHPLLTVWNKNSLANSKVQIINEDAMNYLKRTSGETPIFDIVIIDFPDPTHISLGKLYSLEFYKLVRTVLKPEGFMAVQSFGIIPNFTKPFWCIVNTIESAKFNVLPYHIYIPVLGNSVFTLASQSKINLKNFNLDIQTRFLTKEAFLDSLHFEKETLKIPTLVNTLDLPILLTYYEGLRSFN